MGRQARGQARIENRHPRRVEIFENDDFLPLVMIQNYSTGGDLRSGSGCRGNTMWGVCGRVSICMP